MSTRARDDEGVFARTLSFYVTPDKYAELERYFAESLVPFIAGLDADSHHEPGAEPIRLTLFWSPMAAERTQGEPS